MLYEARETWINVPLTEVVVRAECMDEGYSRDLGENVSEFVDRMLTSGHYPRAAILREAVLCAAVYDFISTYEGDGLYVFIESSGWNEALNRDIHEGLRRLGFHGFDEILSDLEKFMAGVDEEFFEQPEWWKDPALEALDVRFSPDHPIEWYYDQLAAWIRSWQYLRAVPAAEIQTTLNALAARNREPPQPTA